MPRGKKLKLVLDKKVIDRYYEEEYFPKHPRATKRYIKHPVHPSINQWTNEHNFAARQEKKQWEDLIIWWIHDLFLQNEALDKFKMKFTTYMPNNRKPDPDNVTPKFFLDGFTKSGFIQDDNYRHLKELTLILDIDTKRPRTEIEIEVLPE